jgi:hypothetical protein
MMAVRLVPVIFEPIECRSRSSKAEGFSGHIAVIGWQPKLGQRDVLLAR